MAESMESLKRTLIEQAKTYADLTDTIREQQHLVSEGRFDELSRNLEREIALIARGKYLEQGRIELIWEMADRGEIPSDSLTLPQVMDHLGDDDVGSFRAVRSRLRAAVDHLREANARNAEFLRVSLEAIDRMRSQVFGSNGRSYTPTGTAAREDTISLVDRQG